MNLLLLVMTCLGLLGFIAFIVLAIVQPGGESRHPYRRRRNVIVSVERRRQQRAP